MFVYLHACFDDVYKRLQSRSNHFMPSHLLKSQFDALENPSEEQNVFTVNALNLPQKIVNDIIKLLA